MKLIKYVETVEVPTNSTTKTKFYFKEQLNLRNKRVLHIHTMRAPYMNYSPSHLSIINSTVFHKSFLVLVSKNKEIINRIPLINLETQYQGSEAILFDIIIDFPKSYVEVGSIAGLVVTETFIFTFYCNDQVKEVPEYKNINIENIEIKTTPATIQKFYFPDNENLRGKRIQFIEYANANISMTPAGDSIINENAKNRSYLTIATKGQEIIRQIPIFNIIASNLSGYRIPLDNIEIDFPNSYFYVSDTSQIVADEKFFLNVYFYDRILGKK